MTLEALLSAIGVLFLLGGCALATIGLYGLILKPDLFEQLHVSGLVTGPGVILVLLASVGTGSAETVTSAILVIAFVLVTAPISVHVLAQAGVKRYGVAPAEATTRSAEAGVRPAEVEAPPAVAAAATAGGGVAAAERTLERPSAQAGARVSPTGMRVVVAYDGSPGARIASDLAAGLDWPSGSLVRLLAVAGGEAPTVDPLQADRRGAGEHERPDSIETGLEVARRALDERGLLVETVVLRGDPADVIAQETAAFGADLLLTGSRRRGPLASLLGLSATGEIVDRAPSPVLVARTTTVRHVLLTTDGSPQSVAAAELLARWSIFDLARIRVVSVSTDGPGGAGRRGGGRVPPAVQRTVDATAAVLMDAGREVVTEVLHGNPAQRIVETAASRSIDLIVIGSRGRTGLGRTLLGSVAGEIVAAASCSVLIVTPPPRRLPVGS